MFKVAVTESVKQQHGPQDTTYLIKNTGLDFTDALLQVKARLLQSTLGTFGYRTGRSLVTLRKSAFPVLHFQVDNDRQESHNQDSHDGGNDVDCSTDRLMRFQGLFGT